MNYKTVEIDGVDYSVSKPLNSWDMNFHFIDGYGNDKLVDLQDVIDWKYEDDDHINDIDVGASIDDAVDYALDINACGAQFYWKSV